MNTINNKGIKAASSINQNQNPKRIIINPKRNEERARKLASFIEEET
jgi:hypothetical protein